MKRILFLLIAATLTCTFAYTQAANVTVTPTNSRMYSRFIYNYRSVLRDFEIDPDISGFVSTTGAKSHPAFLVKGNDGLIYAVSAADIVVFADKVEVTISDSASKVSYQELQVINVNEKLNLAVTRLPKECTAEALDIDSVWFSDESEQYSMSARMFLKGIPMEVSGDAGAISVLYNRMVASAPDGYYYILPNLSYKYLYSKTADQIADAIDSLSEADYELFRNMNANGDVISAMRVLAGDMAARNLRRNVNVSNTVVKENSVVLEGRNGQQITFVKELGAWRILSDTKPQGATTANSATYTTTEDNTSAKVTTTSAIRQDIIGTLITGKVMIPYNFRDQGVSGSVGIGFAFHYLTIEAVFQYNSFGLYRTWDYDPYRFDGYPYNSDYKYSSLFGLGIRLGGMVPINLNGKLSIVPNIMFEWDSPMLCRNTYYYINSLSPMVGANLFVGLDNRGSKLFVGVQYEQKFNFDRHLLSLKNETMGYIDINFGFVF